jgi:hypothetical protein
MWDLREPYKSHVWFVGRDGAVVYSALGTSGRRRCLAFACSEGVVVALAGVTAGHATERSSRPLHSPPSRGPSAAPVTALAHGEPPAAEGDSDDRAAAGSVVCLGEAAMRLGGLLDDRQPEARAGHTPGVG